MFHFKIPSFILFFWHLHFSTPFRFFTAPSRVVTRAGARENFSNSKNVFHAYLGVAREKRFALRPPFAPPPLNEYEMREERSRAHIKKYFRWKRSAEALPCAGTALIKLFIVLSDFSPRRVNSIKVKLDFLKFHLGGPGWEGAESVVCGARKSHENTCKKTYRESRTAAAPINKFGRLTCNRKHN